MVNTLESGTTVIRPFSQQKYKSSHHKRQEKVKKDLKHIKCFKYSDMGYYAFMCSAQVESKTRLSRRQKGHLRTITCFGCKKVGGIESYLVQISRLNHIAYAKLVRPVWHIGQTGPSLVQHSMEI
jgi:hypothetical protein